MFKWVKNQFLAKLQVEKFISSEYVKLIRLVVCKLEDPNISKEDIKRDLITISESIIAKYNLTEKDISSNG